MSTTPSDPSERIALAHLAATPYSLALESRVSREVVTLQGYGRFKHGDGALSAEYGRALGHLLADRLPLRGTSVRVASSGFAYVPPAADSLTRYVIESLEASGAHARPLRVHRAALSNGDYAKMSLADRQRALSQEGLSVDEDLSGATVIALDDVRVTGVHEDAVDACLRAAGAGEIIHAYVLDAYEARDEPRTESLLNQSGAASTSALLEIAQSDDFVPNARFCKRILALSPESMREALAALPALIPVWLDLAITADDYGSYPAYREGVIAFRAAMNEVYANVMPSIVAEAEAQSRV